MRQEDQERLERFRVTLQRNKPAEPVDRSTEIIPGTKCRDGRGRMVTVISISLSWVKYQREGEADPSSIGRHAFDLNFQKVHP